MKTKLLTLALLIVTLTGNAQNNKEISYTTLRDISYIGSDEAEEYRLERCKLDLYLPESKTAYPIIVWFHGGGLELGKKEIPSDFQKQGIGVVGVNYRLSPRVTHPAYIEDAAEAVAWVFKNIESYGGDPERIYIAGHSAGGYLTLMIGLDKSYLAKHSIDADRIKGLFPISGQTNTHYTIRKERGIPMDLPVVDNFAPLNKARKLNNPITLICGDKTLEMTARYEENAHLASILRSLGSEQVELYELQGFDHGTVFRPACLLILEKMK